MSRPTEQSFLKDVEKHEMQIIRNNDLYRHIRFSQPQSNIQQFDLITWPGYLCYTGDMGCYVFTRVEDMFQFFRRDPRYEGLPISPDYWGQKVAGLDHDGVKQYSVEKFKQMVEENLKEYMAENKLTVEQINAVNNAVEDDLLSLEDSGMYGHVKAHEAIRDFECEGLNFENAWEWDLTDYTTRFIWCCYAIVWGIKQYDEYCNKPLTDHTMFCQKYGFLGKTTHLYCTCGFETAESVAQ